MAWDPNTWSDHVKIHAILMLLGWGYFIPVALFTNSHLYRRQWRHHTFGVHFHMAFGTVGFALSLAGFGYGVRKFTTFSRPNVDTYNMAHGVIGTIATCGMILELLLMAAMRPPKYEGQSCSTWPWWQKVGHFSHRSLGFLWCFLAIGALETGTHITSVHRPGYEHLENQNEKYSAAFIAVTFAAVVTVAAIVQLVIRLYPQQIAESPVEADPSGNPIDEETPVVEA